MELCKGCYPYNPRFVAITNSKSRQYLVKYLWHRSLVNQLLRLDQTATSISFFKLMNRQLSNSALPFLIDIWRLLQDSVQVTGTWRCQKLVDLALGLLMQKRRLFIYRTMSNFLGMKVMSIFIFNIMIMMMMLIKIIYISFHITYLLMIRYFTSYVKIIHVALIAYICLKICKTNPKITLELFFLELGLTVVNIVFGKKHFLDIFQLMFSLNLTYALIPNNYSFVAGFYFLKIVFIYNSLGEAIEGLFAVTHNILTRFLKFFFSILRYTLIEYLFLGLVILCYKIVTFYDKQGELPEDQILLYQLIVTATTIGYGDICPKTKTQIAFFTYAIPFICSSFVLYFNAVIPILGEFVDFLTGNAIVEEGGQTEIEVLQSKIWHGQQKEDFLQFIEQVSRRQNQHDEHFKRLGHNWIAVSANHYERQIPLITSFLPGDEDKELKLKVSSKVRRQYYPRGWKIICAGDISDDLMMVEEGEVSTPTKMKAGFVFNQQGFLNRSRSSITVTASSFVSIWAISLRDLEELSKTSEKLQTLLKSGISF